MQSAKQAKVKLTSRLFHLICLQTISKKLIIAILIQKYRR